MAGDPKDLNVQSVLEVGVEFPIMSGQSRRIVANNIGFVKDYLRSKARLEMLP